jgi:peptidyl-prolyl cis-trans isomerase D
MLDLMRRKKRLKAILWVVIFSLALGMLLFFVPGINMGNVTTDTSAATVDGNAIPMNDFFDAYRRVVRQYSNNGKNRIDPQTLKSMGLPKQVLDQLITEKVLQVIASRFGIDVTTSEVRQAIETYPPFQNQGKFFGIENYKALLAANDLSIEEFEESIRQTELTRKVREIITDSLDISDRELRDEFARSNQKTEVYFTILKKDDFKQRVKPDEAELRSYFDGHKASYEIKEKRSAQYLVVPITSVLPDIRVTEQEIQEEWNATSHDDTVDVAHILLRVDDPSKDAEVKAKAEEILKRAKSGENFAELAKKYSEDTGSASNGGYIGPIQRGQMVKEFEDAAFALKAGEISGLVRSQYGYHIIRVLRRVTPTLESSRNRLIAAIRNRKAKELAKQKAEEAALLAEKSKDLNLAAKTLGIPVEIKDTGLFQKSDGSAGPSIPQALRDEIFQMKEINSIGKVVEIPQGYAFPKLTEVQLPRPGDFAQSRAQVEKDYIDSKATELLRAEAKKLSTNARAEGSLEKAAKEMGLSVKTSQPFSFSGTPDPEIGPDSPFNRVAFELEPGSVSDPLSLSDNEVVLQVKSRSPFDEAAFQKEKPELRTKLLQSKQDAYFQDYVRKTTEQLENDGKIRVNPKALEELPTSYY